MSLAEFAAWLEEQSQPNKLWYVKRLSGNDTLANKAHQAGPYVPLEVLFRLFPSMAKVTSENAKARFLLRVDPYSDQRTVCATWYNGKLRGKTRNEARITGFGGAVSAVLNPENTGAIVIFAFGAGAIDETPFCHVWVTRNVEEEELAEDNVGEIEPGRWLLWSPVRGAIESEAAATKSSCWLTPEHIPTEWMTKFPTGREIAQKAIDQPSARKLAPDKRLLKRRDCEYEIFLSLEEAVELPNVINGFASVQEFVVRAQKILQRRKSRGGNSLEIQTRQILLEEELAEGETFVAKPNLKKDGRPDFIFPSLAAYNDPLWPAARLRILALKTTFKDRWRQVTREAPRVKTKHLLTLQQGVSEKQFSELSEAGIQLVVPRRLHKSYPKAVQPQLMTLAAFIEEVRDLGQF